MEINRNNYEEFFLDYIEGNLPEDQLASFHAFLHANPDLANELEEFDLVEMPANEMTLGNKDFLKKTTSKFEEPSTFNEACIAMIEGDMDENEKTQFLGFLSQFPSKQSDFQLFQKTKLKADLSVVFENKQSLKKGSLWVSSRKKMVAYAITYGSMAACLVVMLGYYFTHRATEPVIVFNENKGGNQQKQAVEDKTEKVKKIDALAYVEGTGNPVSKGKTNTNKANLNKTNKIQSRQPIDKSKTELQLPQYNSKMGIMYQLNDVQMIEVKKKDDLTFNTQPVQVEDSIHQTRLMAFVDRIKDRVLPESLKNKKRIGISDIAQSINKATGEIVKVEHTVDESKQTEIYAINIAGYGFTRTRSMK